MRLLVALRGVIPGALQASTAVIVDRAVAVAVEVEVLRRVTHGEEPLQTQTRHGAVVAEAVAVTELHRVRPPIHFGGAQPGGGGNEIADFVLVGGEVVLRAQQAHHEHLRHELHSRTEGAGERQHHQVERGHDGLAPERDVSGAEDEGVGLAGEGARRANVEDLARAGAGGTELRARCPEQLAQARQVDGAGTDDRGGRSGNRGDGALTGGAVVLGKRCASQLVPDGGAGRTAVDGTGGGVVVDEVGRGAGSETLHGNTLPKKH